MSVGFPCRLGFFALAAFLAEPTAAVAVESVAVDRELVVMGTGLRIRLHAVDRPSGLAVSERIVRRIEVVEDRLSTWRSDSQLSRLNQAPKRRVAVEPPLAEELQAALGCAAATDGAFDPTVGPLIEAWDLRGEGRIPGKEELASARARVGWPRVEIEGRVAIRPPGTRIDAGGFGKGAALDAARRVLGASGAGVTRAVVDLGGDLLLWSREESARFDVAAAAPERRDRAALRLRLPAGVVAGSGDSERARETPSGRISHILDPRSGRPATVTGSVTVWSESGLEADCAATALLVMGPKRGLDWVRGRSGVEAVYQSSISSTVVQATEGMAHWMELQGATR